MSDNCLCLFCGNDTVSGDIHSRIMGSYFVVCKECEPVSTLEGIYRKKIEQENFKTSKEIAPYKFLFAGMGEEKTLGKKVQN